MGKSRITIVGLAALVVLLIPAMGQAQSAEDWLTKGKNETDSTKKIEYLTKAVRLNSDLVEAYIYRGMAYTDLGKYDRAVADYSTAIGLNPDNAQAYNNRAYTYIKLGRYNEAVSDCGMAIRNDPHYPSAFNNRGIAYYGLGRIDEALSDFDKACKLGYDKGCENYYKVK
jgi:tetratricopeptide (TPR) repeat protein